MIQDLYAVEASSRYKALHDNDEDMGVEKIGKCDCGRVVIYLIWTCYRHYV